MNDMIYILQISTNREFADIVQALLETLDYNPTSWHEEDMDIARVEVFCKTEDDCARLRGQVEDILNDIFPEGECRDITIKQIANNSWQEAWKDFFHTTRVSPRIVVKPSWEFYEKQEDDCVIEIDPGMSFGTGNHATTRSCLRFIDKLSGEMPGKSFIDLGCGSGILSIAAAKLGFRDIVAIDNDADAVEIAGKNSELNNVAGKIKFHVADLAASGIEKSADVVCANILSHILLEYAEVITSLVSPGSDSRLILAGILSVEYEKLKDVFERMGLCQIDTITDDEWTSGLFGRK